MSTSPVFRVPVSYFAPTFVDEAHKARFEQHLAGFLRESGPINLPTSTVYFADNTMAIGRAFGFLRDRRFVAAVEACAREDRDLAIAWRTHILTWAAKSCLALDGDFVECGTYRGYSAEVICRYVEQHKAGRRFVLYDLFDPGDAEDGVGHRLPSHGSALFAEVAARFAPYDGVTVVRGKVPDALPETAPERIAFLHLDMNNAAAEEGALRLLWDRIADGGMVVLDDYGWAFYGDQREAADRVAAEHGQIVVELPTGQGLLVKRARTS